MIPRTKPYVCSLTLPFKKHYQHGGRLWHNSQRHHLKCAWSSRMYSHKPQTEEWQANGKRSSCLFLLHSFSVPQAARTCCICHKYVVESRHIHFSWTHVQWCSLSERNKQWGRFYSASLSAEWTLSPEWTGDGRDHVVVPVELSSFRSLVFFHLTILTVILGCKGKYFFYSWGWKCKPLTSAERTVISSTLCDFCLRNRIQKPILELDATSSMGLVSLSRLQTIWEKHGSFFICFLRSVFCF